MIIWIIFKIDKKILREACRKKLNYLVSQFHLIKKILFFKKLNLTKNGK